MSELSVLLNHRILQMKPKKAIRHPYRQIEPAFLRSWGGPVLIGCTEFFGRDKKLRNGDWVSTGAEPCG